VKRKHKSVTEDLEKSQDFFVCEIFLHFSTKPKMGQPLPLPERIPRPDANVAEALKQDSIIVNDEIDQEYLTYKLPAGYSMVDDSCREDLPCFHIINQSSEILFTVHGTWKGSYDNHLSIKIPESVEKFVPPTSRLQKSETSGTAMMGQFMQAVDPDHRPPNEYSVLRKPAYSG
jgi:hypothetical protein